jgi:signal transduction histidine kinase
MPVQLPFRLPPERLPLARAVAASLATVVVAGAVCGWVTAETPATGRALVAWFGGVAVALLAAVTGIAVYGTQRARDLRARLVTTGVGINRLVDEAMPALASRLRDGVSADTALAEVSSVDEVHHPILSTLAQEVGRSEWMRAAATAACANAAGRVQALTTSMLADLREMEDRHSEEVLGDLLKLDHSTAQAGRLADSIAALTGARSGRRWAKPIVMESLLRGAVGRISAYQRVRVHSTSTAAVVGYAAEGVMHALAELMDNATNFSPPAEEVHVFVEEVQAGVVVTIEDGGLTMSPTTLSRAERAVSSESLDLTTLSGTRLGLAVVGRLARKYGLKVFFRPSSRGGTGVVVMIPRQLITQPAPDARSTESADPRPDAVPVLSAAAPRGAEQAKEDAPANGGTSRGLPKRPRGQTLAAAPVQPAPKPPPPRTDAGARFGAFRQASRGNGTSSTASPANQD